MKKITLLFFLGVLVSWTSLAQISIGVQDGTTSYMPVYGLYEYSYSQQIVRQDEIGSTGEITSISFLYESGTTTNSTEWTIYLGHTEKTSYANNTDWVASNDLEEVFSGTVTYPSEGDYMEIVFDDPFVYNNTDNLVVAVTETESGWGGSINFGKTATISGSNRAIYFRSDTVIPDPETPPTATGTADYINTMILGGIQPSCPAPSDLRVYELTATTAEIQWTENGTATEWNVEYGETGFQRGSGTIVNGVTTNPMSIPISEGTVYDFYVQSDCGGGETSAWLGPFTFTTTYCEVSTSNTIDYLSGVATTNAVSDVSYSASSQPAGSYADETAQDFRAYETLVFELTTTYVGGANGVNVWVDWDNNMNFEEEEKVASLANSDATKTFSIEVPAGTQQGTYRMRVRGQYGANASPPPCGNVAYGSTVDFALEIVTPPSCLAPSDMNVSNVTASTLDLGWTDHNSASEWDIEYGPHGFDQGSGTLIEADSNPYTLNIDAGEEYDFYVRSVCDANDRSFWTGPYEYRYCEVSTDYGEYLSLIESEGAVTDILYTASTQPPGSYADETDQTLRTYETQTFELTTTYSYSGNNGVNIWVDWDRDMNFDASELIAGERNSSQTKTFTITIPAGVSQGDYRMRVRGQWNDSPPPCGNVNYGSTVDFTLSVNTPPSCLGPTGLTVESVSSDSAEISWTENGTATEWEVVYGETGFDPETGGNTQSATGTPETTLTGLTSNTIYDFYVKAICGPGDESYLSTKKTFRTTCVPASIPFEEGFEVGYTNGEPVDGCWTQASISGSQDWTANNSETSYNRSPRTGDWNAYLRYSNEDWMFHPVELTEGVAYDLTFYARQNSSSGATIEAAYGEEDTPAGMTISIINQRAVTDGNYQKFTGYFTPTTTGVYYIGIKGTLTSAPWYLSIDDISITEAPGCLPPNNVSIANVTETTADVSWLPLSGETQWEVVYGLEGFDPETAGTTQTVDDDPETTISGLEPDTGYDVYVRAICGAGDESELSEVKNFFTGYCDFTSSSTNYYITDFFTARAVVNIDNQGSGQSPGGYGDFTDMELVSFPTGDFDFEADFNGTSTYGFNMWIDFNGNMEFEESERVYASGGYISRATGTIVIPADVANGSYRMRIVADWLSTNPSPCGSSNNAEAEDYTVTIIDTPTCFPPLDLTLDQIAVDSAVVSWTPQGPETTWKVIYGEGGFDPATAGTTITVEDTPSTTIEGLESNTRYDVYVIAVCAAGDESYRTGPLSFWTVCHATSVPYLMDFETAYVPELPNCTEGENAGNGNMWETLDYNSNGFYGNVLVYRHSTSVANAWFYTQGIEMIEGIEYKISYKYGNVSTAFTEKMKVAFGTSPNVGQMTTELADHGAINQGAPMTETVTFTVPEDGVYYFGFNAYSAPNQFNLYLDDIKVDFAEFCEPATDITLTDITATSVSVEWTESSNAINGYTVNVFLEGADPYTDIPEASETVAAGITTATLTGLTENTSYDLYVVSHCEGGNMGMSEGVNFIATSLGVNEAADAIDITYFPNPVEDRLTISATQIIDEIAVFNLLGQTVMEVKVNDNVATIDMTPLASGTYLIKTISTKEVSTFKVVKE